MPSVEGRSFEVALFEQSRRLVQLLSIEFRISKPDQPVNQVLSGSEYYLISVFKVCVFFFFAPVLSVLTGVPLGQLSLPCRLRFRCSVFSHLITPVNRRFIDGSSHSALSRPLFARELVFTRTCLWLRRIFSYYADNAPSRFDGALACFSIV